MSDRRHPRAATRAEQPIGRYAGIIDPAYADALRVQLADLDERLRAPSARIVAEGRHRMVRIALDADGRRFELAVKVFGRQSWMKDVLDRYRGSKARRTWRAAIHLREHGVGTPAPVGFLEGRRGRCGAERYYLSRYQENRISFKEALIYLFRNDPRCGKFMTLLRSVATEIAAMHRAGLQHNDLGNQNILLRCRGDGRWDDVQFIDLNRACIRPELTPRQRARDLSRIYLPSDLLRVFKHMYHGDQLAPPGFDKWERFYRKRYAVHGATRRYRHPFRERRMARQPAPLSATYPAPRDLWIWDERSAQAIATMVSRDRSRHYAAAWVLKPAAATAAAAWPVGRDYRALRRMCYRAPVALRERVGVAVDPRRASWTAEWAALDELGPCPVLVRLYHHEDPAARAFRLAAVKQLAASGRSVAIALVQDRRAVRDVASWRAFAEQALHATATLVDWVEVGHAVNRVKWGVWTFAEHRRLIETVAEVAAAWPGLKLMGPAAIDFEYPFVAAALKQVSGSVRFQALSHHLYVDRRGPPEARQGAFDALDKFILARALARWAPACEDRLIISEVNWPLAGTGIDSPVGSPYEAPGPRTNDPSVSEEDYAAYMLRYLAIALCSGMVERVYWWRLVARGFGLVDDGDPAAWRRRPAYRALKTFLARMSGRTYRERITACSGADDARVHLLAFEHPSDPDLYLGWASAGACEVTLPRPPRRAWDLYGQPMAMDRSRMALNGCPVYLDL